MMDFWKSWFIYRTELETFLIALIGFRQRKLNSTWHLAPWTSKACPWGVIFILFSPQCHWIIALKKCTLVQTSYLPSWLQTPLLWSCLMVIIDIYNQMNSFSHSLEFKLLWPRLARKCCYLKWSSANVCMYVCMYIIIITKLNKLPVLLYLVCGLALPYLTVQDGGHVHDCTKH